MRRLQTPPLIYLIKVSVSRIAGHTSSFDDQSNNENQISQCLPESMENWPVETHQRGGTGARVCAHSIIRILGGHKPQSSRTLKKVITN